MIAPPPAAAAAAAEPGGAFSPSLSERRAGG
jgi:hypothetical protein